MIKIQVPATSANIGIGFDCLSLAVQMYNTFSVEKSEKWVLEGFDCKIEDNLFLKAYEYSCETMQVNADPCSVTLQSQIPLSRGLGSSASLIVAGLLAANELHENPLSKEELLSLATEMEGHPDNASAALYGNLCLSKKDRAQVFPMDPSLKLTLLIPDVTVSTHEARTILPQSYERSEVVTTLYGALSGFQALLNGNEETLADLMNDRIHEPYRKQLIPHFEEAKAWALAHGAKAFLISGSGSTCIAVSKGAMDLSETFPYSNWRIIPIEIDTKGAEVCRTNI